MALVNGDTKAFTSIYEAYHQNLYLYAFKLVADADEAADMVQEVFVYLWEKRRDLHISGALLPYLYQCVRHRFLNLQDHRKVLEKFVNHVQHSMANGEDTTSRKIDEQELIVYLDQVAAKFSKHMAEVFSMKRQGFGNKEIATKLNLSEKTVKNLSSESIKQLKMRMSRIFYTHILLTLIFF